MATRNIQMNYYNGSSYDQLYPQTQASNLSGILPASKGGTGQSSLASAMYSLINSGATTSLSSSSYVPFITGSSANKCTIDTLLNYIENHVDLNIEIHKFGSYTIINDGSTVTLFTFDSSQIYSILYIEKDLDVSVGLSLNNSEKLNNIHLGRYNILTVGLLGGNLKDTQYLMADNVMGTLNFDGINTVYAEANSINFPGASITITVYGINFI